jgi:hypothetical protein
MNLKQRIFLSRARARARGCERVRERERERERESLSVTVSNDREGICVIKTNLMQYLSSVYFVNQPLHVLGTFVAHHREIYCIYTTNGTCWIYTLYLLMILMMGYKYVRNMLRLIDEIN